MDKAWCYRSQAVALVTVLGYTYRGGQSLEKHWCYRLVLPLITALGYTYSSWHGLVLHLQMLTQSVPLVTALGYTCRSGQGFGITGHSLYPWLLLWPILAEVAKVLVLQVTVCPLATALG